MIRTKFERYPLEEYAARQQADGNGMARAQSRGIDMAAEAKVETAQVPVADLDDEDDERHRPGKRLDYVQLADILPKFPVAVGYLADRGWKTIGDLCDLVGDTQQPLDASLHECTTLTLTAARQVLDGVLVWLRDHPPPASGIVQRCRECGCIENECAGCMLRTGKPCLWANKQKDLCTACVAEHEEDEAVLPEGEPWPGGLTQKILDRVSIAAKLAGGKKLTRPVSAQAFEDGGRLWACIGQVHALDHQSAELLPLIPVAEFEERYVSYPTKFQPDCPANADRETRLQYYTGVVVKVGKKEYAIAPAGEKRTIVQPKEQV